MSRLKGFGVGLAVGTMAPVAAVIGIPFMFTGNTGGSGAGPALACFAAAAVTVVGTGVLMGGAGLATVLSFGGVPWFVTVPAFYFGVWGLVGMLYLGNQSKPKVTSTTPAQD